jgi:hypothetical protein
MSRRRFDPLCSLKALSLPRGWFLPVTAVLIAGLLLGGLPARKRLLEARRAHGLQEVELSKLPPLGAASLLLLGGFRGVAVDVLWLRVIALHQKREYEEERSLIELITRLQPYTGGVWVWQAWNIAYNISVQYPEPSDQWVWIKNGVEFLKGGLELNPCDANLWFTLGHIFRDKMSQDAYFPSACERDLEVNNFEEGAEYFKRARSICFYVMILRGGEAADNPAFQRQMEKDLGLSSFADAEDFFRKARQVKELENFHARVPDGDVFHCRLARVQQILERAELTSALAFSPETLKEAEVSIQLCREESKGLLERWPGDGAFMMFPARIDLAFCDGYTSQAETALVEGRFSDAAFTRARKILDKALAQLAHYRPKYEKTDSRQVVDNKTVEAYVCLPRLVVRRVLALVDRPFAGPAEWREGLRLLQMAQRQLDVVPVGLRGAADIRLFSAVVPDIRQGIEQRLSSVKEPS